MQSKMVAKTEAKMFDWRSFKISYFNLLGFGPATGSSRKPKPLLNKVCFSRELETLSVFFKVTPVPLRNPPRKARAIIFNYSGCGVTVCWKEGKRGYSVFDTYFLVRLFYKPQTVKKVSPPKKY